MNKFKIENNIITVSEENDGIKVNSENDSVLLQNQSIEPVIELINDNFRIVNDYYMVKAKYARIDSLFDDINKVSISIVLHYLYMYNSWRLMYKKQENKDLNFDSKDFDNPSTHDIIFSYFRSRHPNSWMEISSILLGMDLEKLKEYYANREFFYNK